MQTTTRHYIALTSAPHWQTARKLAKAILDARLAACVSIIPGAESHYWWQGKVSSAKELVMVIKTRKTKLKKLGEMIASLHPYDTPELLVIPTSHGSNRFLKWIDGSIS